VSEKINYAWPVSTYDKYDLEALQECVSKNRAVFVAKQIVIMGAGIRGTMFSHMLKRMGFDNFLFSDNNPSKIGGVINEYPIIAYSEVEKRKGNIIVLISVENGFTVLKQLRDSGFIKDRDCFYIDSHQYEKYTTRFMERQHRTENFIIADCGLTDVAVADKEYKSMGEMLEEMLGKRHTKALGMHGMTMRGFYHIVKAHMNYVEVPRRVVVMTNFETFTHKNHLLPRTQHAPLIRMLCDALGNDDLELEEYAQITADRFADFKMDYFTFSDQIKKKMSQEKNDRLVLQMNYMYDFDEMIEPVVYLGKLIDLCYTKKVPILCYIPSVNYKYAEMLLGDNFRRKYQMNVNKLVNYIRTIRGGVFKDPGYELLAYTE